MPTVIGLRFPWGRYHATPWGRPANEAAVEWPPAPWRLLRALYATWRWRVPDMPETTVHEVLSALAEPPEWLLGRWTLGHTRHYLPDTRSGTDKVLDAFVVLDGGEILARWPVELAGTQQDILRRLCQALPYLGRAEAICSARLVSPAEQVPTAGWTTPGGTSALDLPLHRVLAPTVPLDITSLVERTTTWRGSGYVQPKGSRWVSYPVAPASVGEGALERKRRSPAVTHTAAVLLLDAPVLPSRHDTVWVADVVRKAAMQKHGDPSPVLSGKDTTGTPLSGHTHAHYLPLANKDGRLLDRVVVWAPGGLTRKDVEALGRIRRLHHGQPGFRPVRVALQAVGSVEQIAASLSGRSSRWASVTPFAPYRHQRRQTTEDFLLQELQREASARGLPSVSLSGSRPGDWLDFRRNRPGKTADLQAFGLEILFAEPVGGPICLGALSHFGLGRFRPVDGPRG